MICDRGRNVLLGGSCAFYGADDWLKSIFLSIDAFLVIHVGGSNVLRDKRDQKNMTCACVQVAGFNERGVYSRVLVRR